MLILYGVFLVVLYYYLNRKTTFIKGFAIISGAKISILTFNKPTSYEYYDIHNLQIILPLSNQYNSKSRTQFGNSVLYNDI